MRFWSSICAIALFVSTVSQPTYAANAGAPPPACTVSALRFALSEDSPGMGHAGVLLSLRNASTAACRLPASLTFALADGDGATIASEQTTGNIDIAAGASAYAHATWSDGAGGNTPCTDAKKIFVSLGDTLHAFKYPLAAHLCADAGAKPAFTPYAFSLAKDPTALPAAAATASASP